MVIMQTANHEKSANQSVSKLLQLVESLSTSRMPMRLQDIAEATGIPQATCLRYLNALMAEGYAYQIADSGRYSMTWRVCSLGDQVRAYRSLRAVSGDIVDMLSVELGLGICLVVEHDMECMYLDCLYDPMTMNVTLARIGKQTPLYAASSGKVLLADRSEAEIDLIIQEKGFTPITPHTIIDRQQLLAELDRVRAQGFAVDDEECEDGLRCVAVPARDFTGKAAAAVSAFGAVEKLTYPLIQSDVVPALRKAAAELSFRMGYSGE